VDKDPYRVFVYTSLQERATQVSHANTGRLASENEPLIGEVLSNVAKEEARHYVFYRTIFAEVLKRDPDNALESAALLMPSIDMPGLNMPHFREMADVIRRAGIYGPRDYLKIVEELIKFWKIETLTGLKEAGQGAGEDSRRAGASHAGGRHDGDAQPREDLPVRGGVQQGIRDGVRGVRGAPHDVRRPGTRCVPGPWCRRPVISRERVLSALRRTER
jgi:hypothetical protein